MPENNNYVISTDSEDPRVSVKLDLKKDAQLTSDQVEGIYALVLNSLPGDLSVTISRYLIRTASF